MSKHPLIEKNIPAFLLLIVALALIATGIRSGQVQSVLNKACRICMECIGIG